MNKFDIPPQTVPSLKNNPSFADYTLIPGKFKGQISGGFTYLEVMVAVVVLGLVLIPLLSQFYIGFQGNVTAELVTQATDLANELMEEMKVRRFDENMFPDEPVSPASLGIDSGENANDRATFDDIDDYDGWQKSPPQELDGSLLSDFSQFTRAVSVEYVNVNGADWVSSGVSTYYKKITITVSHPQLADKVMETIMSHY